MWSVERSQRRSWWLVQRASRRAYRVIWKVNYQCEKDLSSSLVPSCRWTQVRERTGILVSKVAAVSETFNQPSPQVIYARTSLAPHVVGTWLCLACLSDLADIWVFKVELLLWEKTVLSSFLVFGVNALLFGWDTAFRLCCPSRHMENYSCFREEKRNIRVLVSWRRKGCKYWM